MKPYNEQKGEDKNIQEIVQEKQSLYGKYCLRVVGSFLENIMKELKQHNRYFHPFGYETLAIATRMIEKIYRLCHLSLIGKEDVEDTLLDLEGYLILLKKLHKGDEND